MKKARHSLPIFLAILSFVILIITFIDALTGRSLLLGVDQSVSLYMEGVSGSSQGLVNTFKLISEIGGIEIMVVLGILAAFTLLFRKRWRESAKIFVAVIGTALLTLIFKKLFMRVRPDNTLLAIIDDPSFPSGHSSIAAAFFVTLGYILVTNSEKSTTRVVIISIFSMLVFLIGLSRLVLNVHWLSDVVAGWALGIFISMISIILVRSIFKKLKKKF